MDYADLLSKYIEESKLSLGELSLRLKNKGISADRSYISKLKNGAKPPASEEINKALAEVTGGDMEELITAAYLEKAPENIKKLLEYAKAGRVKQYREDLSNYILSDPLYFQQLRKNNYKLIPEEYKKEYLERTKTPQGLVELLFKTTSNDKIKSFIQKKAVERYNISEDELDENLVEDYLLALENHEKFLKDSSVIKFINIPLLGHISAGKPILVEEHIEEYVDIPNPGNYNPDNLIMLKVKGDSMTGSRIYEGDRVLVHLQQEVENGQIAVVNVNGDEATLKRVKKLENGQTLLIASNDKYEPILITDESARVVGKVIQVIFEP